MNSQRTIPNKTTLIFAAIFLGVLGYDRYLLGYKNWRWKALAMGGLGLWIVYDLYLIIADKLPMSDGRALSK